MNCLSNHKRKKMQFSLNCVSEEILNSFAKKYGTSKSIIIERALDLLAANYHRTITIHYELGEKNEGKKLTPEEMEILKAPWLE